MAKLINTNKLPPKLYHYRAFNDNHIKIITQQTIYFSSPKKYNDPFDCKLFPDYRSISTKQYIKDYFKNRNKKFENKQHKKRVKEIVEDLLEDLVNKMRKSQDDQSFKNLQIMLDNGLLGIICLSKKYDNILMWGHYSRDHTGFCIGFDTKNLLEDLQNIDYYGKVKYRRKKPSIKPSFDESYYAKNYFIKSKDWSYEDEYRFLMKELYNNGDRIVQISKKTISEIFLGCQMNEVTQDSMIKMIRNNLPNVKIYKAERSEKKFALNFIKLEV